MFPFHWASFNADNSPYYAGQPYKHFTRVTVSGDFDLTTLVQAPLQEVFPMTHGRDFKLSSQGTVYLCELRGCIVS